MKKVCRKVCRMCDGKKFKTVIDFGDNPLVNSLIEKNDLDKKEPTFPLVVKQCQDCKLVQIVDTIDSDEIYRHVDYLYFSGDMPKLKEYFQKYAEDLKNRFLELGDFVLEIGSNDGLMLSFFKDTQKILGVDPASNTVVRALKNDVPTLSDGFGERISNSILREYGKAKVIYGNNCIAHIEDLKGVVSGVKNLLSQQGVFVVECNYWGGMVKNKNYSLIYHDHFSYFSVKTWMNFLEKYGMEAFDAIVTPAQGGSLRIFIGFKGEHQPTERFLELVKQEEEANLNSYETCQKYERECKEEAEKLSNTIKILKESGATIAGYGAAAKGFSVLKLAGIDERQIDYFVDDSPAKQGKYTPVSHIPVISRDEAQTKLPQYFFITAPNYKDIIIDKEKGKFKGKFITVNSEIIG